MKRKVIQIADSTQLISLPRKWAKRFEIKKGDELEIEEQGNKLRVSTSKESEHKTTKITLSTAEKFLRRPINVLYKIGYDEVQVDFDDPHVLDLVKEETDSLLGFEIVNQQTNSCLIRNVASALDSEFHSILRRIILMLTEMAKDSYEAISKNEFSKLKEIAAREKTNNKLVFFCQRLINKKGYENYEKTTSVYSFITDLERVCDMYRDLCNHVQSKQIKFSKEELKLFEDANKLLEILHHLFYKFNFDTLYEFREKQIAATKTAIKLLQSKKGDMVVLYSLLSIVEKLRHMTEEIF